MTTPNSKLDVTEVTTIVSDLVQTRQESERKSKINILLFIGALLLIMTGAVLLLSNRKQGHIITLVTKDDFRSQLRISILEDPLLPSDFEDLYCDYMENMNKLSIYDIRDKAELRKRYSLYRKSKQEIEILNKDAKEQGLDSVYGETTFTDWTDEEKESILMNPESAETDSKRRLNTYKPHTKCKTSPGVAGVTTGGASNKAYCGSVGNQAGTGTCWIFSAVAQAECNYNKKHGKTGGDVAEFSQQHIIDCTGSDPQRGGFPEKVIEWENKNAINSFCENYHGWTGVLGTCDHCSSKIDSTECYELDSDTDGTKIAQTAVTKAMSFGMWIGADFFNWNSGTYTCNQGRKGRHAMTIVGQRSGTKVLVKNSWGTHWGEDGYIWIEIDAITNKECHIENHPFTWSEF